MMNGETPDAGKPHIRFDDWGVALAKPSRRSLLCKRIAAVALGLFPLLASADILPSPLPGDMPLHRIGYEIVFEVLAASAAGAAAVRALVKRRWKIRDELSAKERDEFALKIDAVLPQLVDEVIKVNQDRLNELKDFITRQLSENQELAELAAGVLIDVVYEAFNGRIYHPATGECRYCRETEDKLRPFTRPLRRIVSEAGFDVGSHRKTLLEKALARNDELRQALDGVPIELINESIVSRLPPEIHVDEDDSFFGEVGFLWMTEEDLREADAACRSRYVRSRRLNDEDIEQFRKMGMLSSEEKRRGLEKIDMETHRELRRKRGLWKSLLKFVTTDKRQDKEGKL